MNDSRIATRVRLPLNRRAFLRGAGAGSAIAIGLPFLEGLPSRSAWAADAPPVFGFFLVAACGVVGNKFWPSATGALSSGTMAGKAVEALSPYASNLLMIKNVKYPGGSAAACGHAQGLCQALTGKPPQGTGQSSQGGGISADRVIAQALTPGSDPWNLYAGAGNYIAERISFKAAGGASPAELSPYVKFQTLMGVMPAGSSTAPAPAASSTGTPTTVVDDALVRRKSVNDFIKDELRTLQARSDLSMADRLRLEQHLASVRDIEINMVGTGTEMTGTNPSPVNAVGCSATGIEQNALDAMKSMRFTQQGNMIEDVVRLHMQVVALAFACNATRAAALQWGDGTDGTLYSDIGGPGWPFHQLSHRIADDAKTGNNSDAEAAHAKVDAIRMNTFAAGLKHFQDRGLLENSFVYWTNHVSDGPSHSFSNLPIIIAGSAGGKLKQGQYIDGGGDNSRVLATLIEATGASPSGFGAGGGATLDAMKA
jgi:Protein of unknown function (DUF1552)